MKFAVIAATDKYWGIGKDGVIPWRFREDFLWFKETTKGATCFMGRVTYDELAVIMKGKKELLPGRTCIVVTQRPLDDERVIVCNDLNNYLHYAGENNFFIGGVGIFDFGLRIADTAYITRIPGDYECNVKFPVDTLFENLGINRQISLSDTLLVDVFHREDKA